MSHRSWLLVAALAAGLSVGRPSSAQPPDTGPVVPLPLPAGPVMPGPAPVPDAGPAPVLELPEGYTVVADQPVIRVVPITRKGQGSCESDKPQRRRPLIDCYKFLRYGPSCEMPLGCAPCCAEKTFAWGSCCAFFGENCGGCQGGPGGCRACEVRAGKCAHCGNKVNPPDLK